jgi:hypothetical protein
MLGPSALPVDFNQQIQSLHALASGYFVDA